MLYYLDMARKKTKPKQPQRLSQVVKQLFFAIAWVWLATGVLMISFGSYLVYTQYKKQLANQKLKLLIKDDKLDQDSTQRSVKVVKTDQDDYLVIDDARPVIVQRFLERYKSPLAKEPGFAKKLVEIADEYGIDFRLLPAIAMKESGLCKVIPEGTYNCLGLGIHSRGTWGFSSYEEAFRMAAKILKENYIQQGRVTPETIMKKYTPSSKGEWAAGVNQFMSEMKYNDRQKGIEEVRNEVNNNVLEYAEPTP